MRRHTPRIVISRALIWKYVVRSVDRDQAQLNGSLTGFGTEVSVDGIRLSDDLLAGPLAGEQRRSTEPARLVVGMDGRLHRNNLPSFEAGLPHRLLCLALPALPVQVDDTWPDGTMAAQLGSLFPQDVDLRVVSDARLISLLNSDSEQAEAIIDSHATVRSAGGVSLQASGRSTWDTRQGALAHRTFEARLWPTDDDPVREPGTLSAIVERI